jgi:hypothetical protein
LDPGSDVRAKVPGTGCQRVASHTDKLGRISWSLVASMQAFLDGRKSFFACRALLGLIEGGFIVRTFRFLLAGSKLVTSG